MKKNANSLLGAELKPQVSPPVETLTAGKVGKSHHEFIKVMNQEKQQHEFRPITAE